MALYFDTSALVKLIIPEEGTEALETFINRADCGLWTSELSRTELMRACVRRGADASQVRQLLWSFSTLTFDTEMFDLAGRLLPVELRSLDGERSALDVGAPILVISQFTLYGDTRKGRRPSWAHAAPGEEAEPLVEAVVADLRSRGLHVETGQFGAMMEVSLVNDGPFTVLVEA